MAAWYSGRCIRMHEWTNALVYMTIHSAATNINNNWWRQTLSQTMMCMRGTMNMLVSGHMANDLSPLLYDYCCEYSIWNSNVATMRKTSIHVLITCHKCYYVIIFFKPKFTDGRKYQIVSENFPVMLCQCHRKCSSTVMKHDTESLSYFVVTDDHLIYLIRIDFPYTDSFAIKQS